MHGLTRSVMLLALTACASPPTPTAEGRDAALMACPRGSLPAYAHNDYENTRPLVDALTLGFRGVEADVFLVDGVLRIGHDRRRASRSATLEDSYLEPLAAVVRRCGSLTVDRRPFLLTVDIKERSQATYDAVVQLLRRYHDPLLTGGAPAPVEVVLVGWDPRGSVETGVDRLVSLQHRITRIDGRPPRDHWERVRLISLDYGKTIGRAWTTAGRRRRWLDTLARFKSAAPGRLVRVHNVPTDRRVYSDLLAAGVDLIGVEQLAAARQILTTTERDSRRD
jgi:hypothetical protein